MRIRRLAVLATASAVLAFGGTAALAADAGTSSLGGPVDQAARCEHAQSLLEKLQARAAKLSDRIAKLQARIDSGDLTDKKLAKAEHRLTKLQTLLTKLQTRIDKLGQKIADHCSSDTGTGSGDTSGGTPE